MFSKCGEQFRDLGEVGHIYFIAIIGDTRIQTLLHALSNGRNFATRGAILTQQKKRIRIGLLGIGRIAQRHIDALAQHVDNAEIVALCDTDSIALEAGARALPSARTFSNLSEMLAANKTENLNLDLVTVCTPSGLHPEHGREIAKVGIHVLVEKPMGVQLNDARSLVHTCREMGVALFIVKQNRFNPPVVALRRAIDEGGFGRIYMIVSNVFWTRPQAYYDQAKWRGTWGLDGGAFLNQASHYVDLVQWLGGPVRSVQAKIATLARNIEAEDTGVALIEFESGTIASLNVTMLTYPKNLEGSITVIGEKGTVRIGGVALNKIEEWNFVDSCAVESCSHSYTTDSVYGYGHGALYENIFRKMRGEPSVTIDGEEGLKSMELFEAIYKSARENTPVEIACL